MILLQASHISKQFDGHEVLLDASVVVQSGNRVGLIGQNGAGKSTLLRILMGEFTADGGTVSIAKNTSLGYVAQFRVTDDAVSVFDFVAESFQHLFDLEKRLRTLEIAMANPDVYGDEARFASISADYDGVRQRFEAANGYATEARIRRVLDGLNFPTAIHQQAVGVLSGGQKTRLALAKLLATEPDILVLDEPTNYLDTDTMDWLEGYLRQYVGAVLVVSHDRYFLDSVATHIVELEVGRTTAYPGNYGAYLDQKSADFEANLKRYEAQQEEIKRLETFVEKNIVRASTTKRAQSRRKFLEKMVRFEQPKANTPKMALRFTCERESGKDVLRTEDLRTGFPGRPMQALPLNLHVARGQRLAILGPNGIGKTTLLRTLVGELPPLGGTAHWGQHVAIGYYDQEQTGLDDTKTVLELIWDEHPGLDNTTVRAALGRFLFRGEHVNAPVATLSGGERSRLALCRLMLRQPNVLIMDEPTNHLDLLAKEVLEDALAEYDGSIVMVSHDRYFIDAIATHVLVLGDTDSKLYIGNYTEYVLKRTEDEKLLAIEAAENPVPTPAPPRSTAATTRPVPPTSPPADKPRLVRSADVRKLRDRIAQLESDISANESRQQEIGRLFTDPETLKDGALTTHLQHELTILHTDHTDLLANWETLALELEAMEGHP